MAKQTKWLCRQRMLLKRQSSWWPWEGTGTDRVGVWQRGLDLQCMLWVGCWKSLWTCNKHDIAASLDCMESPSSRSKCKQQTHPYVLWLLCPDRVFTESTPNWCVWWQFLLSQAAWSCLLGLLHVCPQLLIIFTLWALYWITKLLHAIVTKYYPWLAGNLFVVSSQKKQTLSLHGTSCSWMLATKGPESWAGHVTNLSRSRMPTAPQ